MFSQGGELLRVLAPAGLRARLFQLSGDLRDDEPLAGHTTIGVGGPARIFLSPATVDDLATAVRVCREWGEPWILLGGGSNVLFSDRGWDGVVIDTTRLTNVRFEGRHRLRVAAGAPLASVVEAAASRGVRSLDFLVGIPGTIGGALAMNAGIPGASIGDAVHEVTALPGDGAVRVLSRRMCRFGYRDSLFRRRRYPILEVCLDLDGPSYDRDRLLSHRRATQPLGVRSAGCVFKNPGGQSAGFLIEKEGLKRLRVGNAMVSERHANFIVNLGGARSAEIRKVIDIVRQKVYKSLRICLELEIEVIDGCEGGD